MADVPRPGPVDEALGLTLFDDEPVAQGDEPENPPQPPADGEPPPAPGGLRETILRFLEKEL